MISKIIKIPKHKKIIEKQLFAFLDVVRCGEALKVILANTCNFKARNGLFRYYIYISM